MVFFDYLQMAAGALLAHRFRSALTVLSITLGALAIVLMTSLAQSGLTSLIHSTEELGGSRIVMIAGHLPERAEGKLQSYRGGLTLADRDVLLEKLPHLERAVLFASLGRSEVQADTGAATRSDLVVGESDFLTGLKLRLAKGRMFSAEEASGHARVCIVGWQTAKHLWGKDVEAVGHSLTVAGIRCLVIGQLDGADHWGEDWGWDWLDYVLLPRPVGRESQREVVDAATTLVLKTDAQEHNDLVKRIANAVLTERHHGLDDFQIWDFRRLLAKFKSVFAILEAIVGVIAGIALLVGGIGVMNMMLVSVSERVREIGIRKALGASPRDIAAQFVCEAVVLSGSGGALGAGLGVLLAWASGWLIAQVQPGWVGVVSMPAVFVALGVSLGVGVIFGYFPARRAGRLDPVQAIRR